MTEEEIEIIKEVKGMLTGGVWGNDVSKAPVLCRNDDRTYGKLVDLNREIDFHEVWCTASRSFSESGINIYPRYFVDLGEEDSFMVYMLDRFHTKSPETIESIILSWAKPFLEEAIDGL